MFTGKYGNIRVLTHQILGQHNYASKTNIVSWSRIVKTVVTGKSLNHWRFFVGNSGNKNEGWHENIRKKSEKHGEMVSAWIDSWSSTVPSQPCDPKVWGTATGLDFMVASQFWGPHSVGNHHHSGGLSKNARGSSDMKTEPIWIMNNTQMIFGSLFLPKHSEIHARLDVRTMTPGWNGTGKRLLKPTTAHGADFFWMHSTWGASHPCRSSHQNLVRCF